MLLVAIRLSWPYVLTPWRSPLLRWRLETYGVLDEQGRLLHAEDITAARFAAFVIRHPTILLRFLRWAATL
ncbi:MAG: hypothetical protein HY737_01545 [Candidatus Omnitrophica bacterium]|nr:hypothetical protein [Candidatus Omnitrophota bacterium]